MLVICQSSQHTHTIATTTNCNGFQHPPTAEGRPQILSTKLGRSVQISRQLRSASELGKKRVQRRHDLGGAAVASPLDARPVGDITLGKIGLSWRNDPDGNSDSSDKPRG